MIAPSSSPTCPSRCAPSRAFTAWTVCCPPPESDRSPRRRQALPQRARARRRRRRAARGAVALRAPHDSRRPQHRADHALPRGGRGALQPHRHAEGGTHRGARSDAQPARQLFRRRAAPAPRPRGSARRPAGQRARGRRRAVPAAPCELPRPRRGAGAAAPGRRRHPRDGARAARPRRSFSAGHRARVMSRFLTLCHKELLRLFKVSVQTIAAPVLTTLLYLVIFGHALDGRLEVYEGVRYTAFLVPGLVMMSVLQNAFANSSSSLIQSKITGNIVFVLIAPISYAEFFAAYVVAAIVRGLVVGLCVLAVTVWFVELRVQAPLWVLAFALLGAALLGTLGLVAGVVSDKIDQVSAFQNFVVLPLSFLSGVFYSIHSLPPVWQQLSHANPFFYMVDGFRYGFFGASDFPPLASPAIVFAFLLAVSSVTLALLKSGYKMRY